MLVAAATVGNAVAGVRFARGRTDYVRGLEDQIITSAALLRGSEQLARAVDRYPIWASGSASGYLTPSVLAGLARHSLLPEPGASLMRPTEVLNDQTWLDVTGLSRPLSHGPFRLLGSAGLKWSEEAPAPGSAELLGAHRYAGSVGSPCTSAGGVGAKDPHGTRGHRPSFRHAAGSLAPRPRVLRPGSARLISIFLPSRVIEAGAHGGVGSGSVWVSLGPIGGNLLVSFARPWGLEGLPGSAAVQGQVIIVAPGGYTWVNDRAAGDDLVLQLPRGRSVELCGLSLAGQPRLEEAFRRPQCSAPPERHRHDGVKSDQGDTLQPGVLPVVNDDRRHHDGDGQRRDQQRWEHQRQLPCPKKALPKTNTGVRKRAIWRGLFKIVLMA